MCVGAAPDPGQGGRAVTACHLCRIRMRRPLSVRGGRPVRGTTQRRGPPGCPRADPPADIRRQTRYATWTIGRQAGRGLHEAGVRRRLARSVRYPLRGPGGSCPYTICPESPWLANATPVLVHHSGNTRRHLYRARHAQGGHSCRVRGCVGSESVMVWTASYFSRITAWRARRIGCAAQITTHIRPDNRSKNNPKKHLATNPLYSV